MPTITTEGEPPPRDYYAEALTRALDFGPARAAQLQALILALIERGVAADDIRSARLLAPLFDTPSIYPGPAASRGAGGDGTSDTVVDPSPPLPPPKPNPWWLTLAGRSALAVLGLVLLVLALIWLSQPSPVQPVVETPPTISTLAPSPEVTTTPTSAEQPQISEYLFSWPALAAIAALVLAASFWPALVRWWQRRKQRQLRRDPLPDRAPLAKIATRVARARLFTAAGMPEAIRRLRRYRAIPSQRLDVRRSLRATLAQGGAPSIRYARRRLSPDFVFLSERLQPHDHLPEFAEAWKDRLVEAGIGCEHFEFWGDPNTLLRVSDADGRRDDNAVRQPLDAVLARHDGGSVVVMLESFVALDATEDPQWLARSRQIATPFLMNPRDYPFWANEEARLADLGLPGFAATVPGTMALAERTDRAIDDPDGTPAPTPTPGQADLAAFLFSHRAMVLASDPPSAAQIATIVDTLERWLERGAFDWLRALAVLPMVNPGFTCFVGATLRDESLVTHERYLALSRLPWLRSAQMPDWLRLALLETLAPDALQRAAAVAAAYLAPPGPAVEREEQLVELRRAAEHPASRRKLAERLAAGATPGLTDKLLLEVLKGRPPDQLGVAFRGEIADEPHDWRRDPRVHAAVFAVFAGAAVLALQPTAWREAGGFSLFASRSDPNSQPSALPDEVKPLCR